MTTKLLYIFTRTPLHVGAGASVGAIDQPVQRERHTGFPIIPASSLKGSFADQWPTAIKDSNGKAIRLTTKKVKNGEKEETVADQTSDTAWLFGSDTTDLSFAGSLIFSEARVLVFPIRSAKGSFAWITCPLMLKRAKRDGVLSGDIPPDVPEDDRAIFLKSGDISKLNIPDVQKAPLDLDGKIVLEEYCFSHTGNYPAGIAKEISGLVSDDLFKSVTERLVILTDGMMSHFVNTACEVAQHVRISDETGTAERTGLFNQENVPSETLFYSVLRATRSRVPNGEHAGKEADSALAAFSEKVDGKVFQFGADATTGLGFCSTYVRRLEDTVQSPS